MRSGILMTAVLLTSLFSCQKKNNTVAGPADVTINISSPLSGQVYHSGDTILINADVSYASELHGYELKITDSASGYILYDSTEHVHNDHFTINDKWINTGAQPLTLKLSLVAAIDHDGKTAEKDITFQYQP